MHYFSFHFKFEFDEKDLRFTGSQTLGYFFKWFNFKVDVHSSELKPKLDCIQSLKWKNKENTTLEIDLP